MTTERTMRKFYGPSGYVNPELQEEPSKLEGRTEPVEIVTRAATIAESKKIAAMYQKPVSPQCAGCEGKPISPNLPCSVCEKGEPELQQGLSWREVKTQGIIIGVRMMKNGQQEYLCHNKALCHPYYTANDGHQEPPLQLAQLPASERIERMVKCVVCGWHTLGVPQSDLHDMRGELAEARRERDAAVNVGIAQMARIGLLEGIVKEYRFGHSGGVE